MTYRSATSLATASLAAWLFGCTNAETAATPEPDPVEPCVVSLPALAADLHVAPTPAAVDAALRARLAVAPTAADQAQLRLVQEAYFSQMGLPTEAFFSRSATLPLGCGAPPTDEIAELPCFRDQRALTDAVAGCLRLQGSHVDPDAVQPLFDACLDALVAGYEPLRDTACEARVRDPIADAAAAAIATANRAGAPLPADRPVEASARAVDTTSPLVDAATKAEVGRRMNVINSGIAFAVSVGLDLEERLRIRTSLSQLAAIAYALPPLPTETSTHNPSDVLALLDEMDQYILTTTMKRAYHPLTRVHLVSFSLRRIAREIRSRADVLAVACRLRTCGADTAVQQVARGIVALADSAQDPPADYGRTGRRGSWVTALREADGHRANLIAALAAYPDDDNTRMIQADIGAARAALDRLSPAQRDRRPLSTRLHDENRNTIRAQLGQIETRLEDALNQYQIAKTLFAKTQIDALGTASSEVGLGNQLVRMLEILADAETRAGGLRRLHDDAELRWSALGSFAGRVERMGLEGQVTVGHPVTIAVELPAAAKFTDTEATAENLGDLAVRSWTVSAGDSLQFATDDQWSPTCALNTADVFEDPLTRNIDRSVAEIGPEGYHLQWSESGFSAESSTHNDSEITAASVCGSVAGIAASAAATAAAAFSPTLDPGMAPEAKLRFSFSSFFGSIARGAGNCWRGIFGAGNSDITSSTSGSERRWSGSFASGLRLDNTPFPTLPAGSLVLAVVSGGTIVDAQVVRSRANVLIRDGGEAYLVVNDASCDSSSGTLNVQWTQSKDLRAQAAELALAMADIATYTRAQIELIAAAGIFTSADAQALETHAYGRLRERCGCDVRARFPEAVIGMFDEWLAYETAQLQRRVDMQRLALESRLHLLDLEALGRQLALTGETARWVESLKHLAFTELSDTSLENVHARVRQAANFVERRVIPVLEVRYPDVLPTLRSEHLVEAGSLDHTVYDVGVELQLALRDTVEALIEASTDGRFEGRRQVLLWIPKPGGPRTIPHGGAAAQVLVASDDDIANLWRVADDGTVGLAKEAQIRITPDELYNDTGVPDSLLCEASAAVLDSMILYAVDPDSIYHEDPLRDPFNSSRFALGAELSSPVFITERESMAFDLDRGNTGEVRMARGSYDVRTVVTDRLFADENSLRGVSPFVDIRLRRGDALDSWLRSSVGIAVIMNISAYSADRGVSHCE